MRVGARFAQPLVRKSRCGRVAFLHARVGGARHSARPWTTRPPHPSTHPTPATTGVGEHAVGGQAADCGLHRHPRDRGRVHQAALHQGRPGMGPRPVRLLELALAGGAQGQADPRASERPPRHDRCVRQPPARLVVSGSSGGIQFGRWVQRDSSHVPSRERRVSRRRASSPVGQPTAQCRVPSTGGGEARAVCPARATRFEFVAPISPSPASLCASRARAAQQARWASRRRRPSRARSRSSRARSSKEKIFL